MPPPPGPFEHIPVSDAATAPLYLIPFDKKGRCEGPQTRAHLVAAARSGAFTDVHVFSHGWNNVFKEALDLYREFFAEYFALRRSQHISNATYKPLLVGILWPSTALVFGSEATPQFAAGAAPEQRKATFLEEQAALRELASELRDEDVSRFYELAGLDRPLTQAEARELARILLPAMDRSDPTGEEVPQAVTVDKLLKAWTEAAKATGAGAVAGVGLGAGAPGALQIDEEVAGAGPAAAGAFDFLDPRQIVRGATVYVMKDRAGTVGANGVAPLVRDLLAIPNIKVHLMGHSYGGKVVLSALTLANANRKASSMLLLQPAVNHLCFADNVQGRKGGYRRVLDLVERSIFTTFSSGDFPLSKTFHLALRRDGDLGEVLIAGAPSQFAALGGFGPGGLLGGEGRVLQILAPPNRYPTGEAGVKVYALDGSANRITGHGDVRNDFTEWALVNLTL